MRRTYAVGVLVVCCALAEATTITVTIRDWQDGRDWLLLQGSTIQWQHWDHNVPGVEDGHNDPTYISTTLDGVPVLTDYPWMPGWPGGTGSGAYSSVFTGLDPALPVVDMFVTLELLQVRWSASLIEYPSASNGYMTTVELDDNPPPSADWYIIRLTYTDVPEPVSIGLLLSALLLRRR